MSQKVVSVKLLNSVNKFLAQDLYVIASGLQVLRIPGLELCILSGYLLPHNFTDRICSL